MQIDQAEVTDKFPVGVLGDCGVALELGQERRVDVVVWILLTEPQELAPGLFVIVGTGARARARVGPGTIAVPMRGVCAVGQVAGRLVVLGFH